MRLDKDVECQFSEKSYAEAATEYAVTAKAAVKEKASKAVHYGTDLIR